MNSTRPILALLLAALAAEAPAYTRHYSFRNGYPVAIGGTLQTVSSSVTLGVSQSRAMAKPKVKVVTKKVVVAPKTTAPTAPAAPAEPVALEALVPGVTLVGGNGAAVSRGADGLVCVDVGKAPADRWPAAYYTFPVSVDLSRMAALRVTFTNRCDRPLRICLKVKGETVQGQLPEGGLIVPAHATRTKTLRLYAEAWAFDKPHGLLGLKRPPRVGASSSYALDRVSSISAYLPMGECQASFGILSAALVPAAAGEGRQQMRLLKAASFSPWVDEFGQANFAEWGDKVHSKEEFLARAAAEAKELAAHPFGIPGADRFGGWAEGPQLAATGFFRTEKVDGRWWLVDPDGHLYFAHGVNCGWELASTGITGREKYFEKLPPKEGRTAAFWEYHRKPVFRNYYGDPAHAPFWAFSFSAYDLWLKFGPNWRQRNTENTVRRLLAWGLNLTTGTPGDVRRMGKVPYVTSIGPSARKIVGAKGYWGNLLDPFAPEFAESCRKAAEARRDMGTNAFCLGWTSNNELSWGTSGEGLARSVLASPTNQPARIALLALLASRGRTPETATPADWTALGEAVAEKYYSTVRAAIKRVAPNALYLGDRNDKHNPEVFRVASRYLDVVTVNTYDFHPTVELPPGSEDKPLMVTEFHFGCYDTGYFYASLIPVKDQAARAACYRDYVLAAVDNPHYVGAHWFCWRDCPITGQLGEGANAQCGLVSTTDIPYTELIGAVKSVSREMYPRRASAVKNVKKEESK